MTCNNCGHDMWDHELIDESYDSLCFGKCEEKNCDCEGFEDD